MDKNESQLDAQSSDEHHPPPWAPAQFCVSEQQENSVPFEAPVSAGPIDLQMNRVRLHTKAQLPNSCG